MIHTLARLLALGLLATAIVWVAPGHAADDFKYEEGYEILFNGKDLSGWRYTSAPKVSLEGKTETPDKRFQVVDGVIVANAKDDQGKGGIRDLFKLGEFNQDFHLKLEFRAAPRADSGVYIRGVQLQVRDYPTVGPYKRVKFNNAEWNELDILVSGPLYTATVNGKAIGAKDTLEVTVKDGKPVAKLNGQPVELGNVQVRAEDAALCRCNGDIIEKAMKVPTRGGIGLHAEDGKFEFRRIRIKELPRK